MSTMPPIKAGTGSSKSAKNKGAPLDKRSTKNTDLPPSKSKKSAATGSQPATTDDYDFMGQTYKDHYDRSVPFITELLKRLSDYEEEVDRLNDAFANNTDLPPPKLKKSAATGSQPFRTLSENRNKELAEQLKKTKHELAKLKRATTDDDDFMVQTYKDHYYRSVLFINKLLERLSKYEEEVDRLNDAFAKNADLPPPKLKKSAATGSQPTNWQNEKMKLENRNKELDEQLKKNKHELAKLKSSASTCIQATRPRSAKSVLETDSDDDSDILTKNLQECKNAIEKLREDKEKEITDLKKNNESLKSKVYGLEEQRKTLESLERENADLKANMAKTMEERIQRGKSDLTEDNEKLRKTLDALRQENKKLIAENEKKTKDGEELQREISSLTKDSQEKKKGGGKGSRTSSADEISKLQDEVDELRNRLKKMAGTQLTDNNPAIAVLSDPNRPLSLGEKFSELYENEWTDAMEEIAETMSDETKVIKLLLDIVCDAYKFCLDKSDRFMDKINSTLNGLSEEFSSSETMPKEIAKTNKDYRKRLAVYVVSFLQKDFAKEMKTKVKAKVGTQTEAYIKRCVLVCWFMTVQDPKVHITTKTTEKFDEDLYKTYTKKGKHLDYLVWPALHLHEGGPLIGKGVAQGKP